MLRSCDTAGISSRWYRCGAAPVAVFHDNHERVNCVGEAACIYAPAQQWCGPRSPYCCRSERSGLRCRGRSSRAMAGRSSRLEVRGGVAEELKTGELLRRDITSGPDQSFTIQSRAQLGLLIICARPSPNVKCCGAWAMHLKKVSMGLAEVSQGVQRRPVTRRARSPPAACCCAAIW
jgi:hypothetical protein